MVNTSSPDFDGDDPAKPLILVVGDDRAVSQVICATLAQDYRTVQAFDGDAGLRRASELRPDLIVADLLMPRSDGESLIGDLRADAALGLTPVILVTPQDAGRPRPQLFQQGARDYLTKPFHPDELLVRVENLLTMNRARQVLQHELDSELAEVDVLAREIALRKRAVETAMTSAADARDRAQRTSQLKSRFLGMVSHELRTPLTALSLQVERMQRNARDLDSRNQESLRRISCSAGRLRELIETLLEYARVEGGRIAVNVSGFDLAQTIRRTIENHRYHAEQKVLELRLSLPSAPAPVRTDERLIELVVSNLIDNAIKFTSRGSVEVTLVARHPDGYLLSVCDSGPGIPEEQRAAIFEPFQQLGPPKQRLGIGLGLALVRDMAAAVGGRVDLQSKVGEGSTFSFLIPPVPPAPIVEEAGEEPGGSRPGR